MAMRLNGQNVVGLRLNGADALARLNGSGVYSSGARSLVEEWGTWVGGRWNQRSDPADEMAVAELASNPSRIVAGVPSRLWSGKPSSSTFTYGDYMNEVGTWETVSASRGTAGGLFTGIILGGDAVGGRMLIVEWDLNAIVLRYRTSVSNAWISLGSNNSFRHSSGDVIRVERFRDQGMHRVQVFQNNVRRGNWRDSTGIPGSKGHQRIGVRLQGDRGWNGSEYSPSIDRFTFTAG